MSKLKVALSLSPGVVTDLDYISGRLGISRSALVDNILTESLPVMRKLFEQVPYSPTPVDVVRARGESAVIVQDRINELQALANDLFAQ